MRDLRIILVMSGRLMVAEAKRFLCSLHAVAADVRRNRTFIENEIHRGKYKLYSKNDDDLPVFTETARLQPTEHHLKDKVP